MTVTWKKVAYETDVVKKADIDDTPVDGETTAPISSNWAFDHAAAADPHTGYLLKQMAENNPLLLDAALSADGQYSGICEAGIAGAALAFGDLVYLAVADTKWEKTDADAVATAFGKLGVCVSTTIAEDATGNILLWGKVRGDTKFPTLTIGAPVFVSTTLGEIQAAAPSGSTDIVRIVGYGNTVDELFFCPDNTYLELV